MLRCYLLYSYGFIRLKLTNDLNGVLVYTVGEFVPVIRLGLFIVCALGNNSTDLGTIKTLLKRYQWNVILFFSSQRVISFGIMY